MDTIKRVQDLMQVRDMNLCVLAKKCGISYSTIQTLSLIHICCDKRLGRRIAAHHLGAQLDARRQGCGVTVLLPSLAIRSVWLANATTESVASAFLSGDSTLDSSR